MSGTEMAARRFWKEVGLREAENGYEIMLDSRALKTPQKNPFRVSLKAVAEAVAAEWAAVDEMIDPDAMPMTRAVNSAIDRVAPQREGVIDAIAAYGASDLICYRADDPAELVERQAVAWDQALAWARGQGADLHVTDGLMPVEQSLEAVAVLRQKVAAYDDLALTALFDLTTISGSLVLALMVAEEALTPDEGWTAARVDESYQAEKWGQDEDAAASAARKQADFLFAAGLLELLRNAI